MANPAAAASGTVAWNQAQGNTVNTFTGQLYPFAVPEVQNWATWLSQLTSPDPTARMTAAAPQIADITAVEQGNLNQLSNLPRGGEQDYLKANASQNAATQISNLLTGEYAAAQQAQGALGERNIANIFQGTGEAANIEQGAGSLALQLSQLNSQGQSGLLGSLSSMLPQILQSLGIGGAAGAAAGGGGDAAAMLADLAVTGA